MLTIYNVDKPSDDVKIDTDVNAQFVIRGKIYDDDVTRRVLRDIEHAQYLSSSEFIDRFGYKLHASNLSTGTKALLLATHTNDVICFDECGGNIIGEAIKLSTECDMNIYISYPLLDNEVLLNGDEDISVTYNGDYMDDIEYLTHGGICYGLKSLRENGVLKTIVTGV